MWASRTLVEEIEENGIEFSQQSLPVEFGESSNQIGPF